MKVIVQGLVTGCRSWEDKDKGKQSRTAISLGPGTEVEINGNGLVQGQPVFIVGDVMRARDGRAYLGEGAKLYKRDLETQLEDVAAQVFGAATS